LAVDIPGLVASFMTFFGIYAILSLSLNLEYGFGGQPNFGKVLFYSIGAYVAGYVSTLFLLYLRGQMVPIASFEATILRAATAESDPLANALTFIASIVVAFILAGIIGYFASFPALKLREDYLGITLLVIAEMARIVIRGAEEFSGGTQGIGGITNPFIWIEDVKIRYLSYALLVWVFVILAYITINRLANSPYGRLLKSVRDDEMASQSLGKKVPLVKGQVLVVGSAFSGMAGVLYTFYSGFVQADGFIPIVTFTIWVMVIVGGTANVKGSIIGALIISVIDLITRVAAIEIQTVVQFTLFDPNYLRYIAYSILIILTLMFRPKGLIPEKPVKTPAQDLINKKKKLEV